MVWAPIKVESPALRTVSPVTRYIKIPKLSYDRFVDGELRHRKEVAMGWEAQMIQHMADNRASKLV